MNCTELCPRCAYDLSGETSRWVESCPIRGRCPECGLAFDWVDVLDPDRWRLQGLVEHAKGPRRFLRWSFTTWGWAILPWHFWSRVSMHHRVRVWPLLAWLMLVVAVPHVCRAVAITIDTVLLFGTALKDWENLNPLIEPIAQVWNMGAAGVRVRWIILDWPLSARWLSLAALLWPVVLCLMPISLSRARVHWKHVLRATVYSAAVPGLIFTVRLFTTVLTMVRMNIGSRVNVYNDLGTIADLGTLFERIVIFVGIPWLALWWLLALTRGWKLRRGWIAWLAMVVLMVAVLVTFSGFEFTFNGRIYRI